MEQVKLITYTLEEKEHLEDVFFLIADNYKIYFVTLKDLKEELELEEIQNILSLESTYDLPLWVERDWNKLKYYYKDKNENEKKKIKIKNRTELIKMPLLFSWNKKKDIKVGEKTFSAWEISNEDYNSMLKLRPWH